MDAPSRSELRGKWRKRLMLFWVLVSIAFAIYLAVAAPLVPFFQPSFAPVALALPPIMVVMLISGLAWLILLVLPRRRETRNDS